MDLRKRKNTGRWVALALAFCISIPLATFLSYNSAPSPAYGQSATDARAGLGANVAFKPSVAAASTTNIATFPPTTLITLDDVASVAGGRYLIKDQTDQTENGIWVAQASGTAWTRATDFNGPRDIVAGTAVIVQSGGTNHGGSIFYVTNTSDPTIGTDNITWGGFGSIATTPFVDTLHDDTTVGAFLTTLGFSAYFQTIIDSVNAAALQANLSLGTAADEDIGTSGANVGLLNGNNTYSGSSTFSGSVTATGAVDLSGASSVDLGSATGTYIDLSTGTPSSGEVNASGYLVDGSAVSFPTVWTGTQSDWDDDSVDTHAHNLGAVPDFCWIEAFSTSGTENGYPVSERLTFTCEEDNDGEKGVCISKDATNAYVVMGSVLAFIAKDTFNVESQDTEANWDYIPKCVLYN